MTTFRLIMLAAAVLTAGAACAVAQPFPAKAIRVIVPSAPGGGNDFEILRSVGYTAEDIAAMRASGAI